MNNEQGKKESLDSLLQGEMSIIWRQYVSNKLGRLAQGIGDSTGHGVMEFISFSDVP